MEVILFIAFAVFAVASAVSLVVQTHPISSALSLIGVMVSLAVLYFLLGAEFIAAAQLVVYAGAIMVLFVFVIMLLNAGTEATRGRSWTSLIFGIPAIIALLGSLAYFMQKGMPNLGSAKFGDFQGGTAYHVGLALFTEYLLPFEVTSVLILIAIVGAIVLARKELD